MADMKQIAAAVLRRLGADGVDYRERSAARVQDRYSEYPSRGLTPVKLARIFRQADEGDVLAQMELFEEMEEKDPHLFSQLQTRKNAVTGLDFEVVACSADEIDKQAAEFVTDVIGSIEGIEDIFFDLLDAIGKGIAISEILWKTTGGKTTVTEIKSRHQKRLRWDYEDQLRITTQEEPAGLLLQENKFIVHQYKARSGHPARAGVLRVVAWMYLFKNYDVKDWVRFCELFGMPLRLGKYNPGASEEDKAALMRALIQLGADAAGIMPEGTDIDLREASKTTSIDVYERLARYCDEQVSKAILGQTLTSDSGGGSFAQSKTHNEVRHDLTAADCKALAGTLKRDLIRPLILFNFGAGVGIPSIRFDCKEPEDLKAEAEILDTLINQAGLKVPAGYVYKKFNIPQPEDGEEILQPYSLQAQGTGGVDGSGRMTDELPLKALKDPGSASDPMVKAEEMQGRIDKLAEKSRELSAPLFQKMFAPILAAAEEADSLEELADQMKHPDFVKQIFAEMQVDDFEELLQRSMMAADLTGRMVEDEDG